jgi:signal transduction histidine kinase
VEPALRQGEAVRDHALGIPADALEQVFERYTRLESGSGRSIPGTGLGLPIVWQIVELHGGRAWAESVMGESSTFHFTLPLGTPPTSPATAVDQGAGPSGPSSTEGDQ